MSSPTTLPRLHARTSLRSIISLAFLLILSLSTRIHSQTPAAFNNLGPSSSSIINDVKYFGSSLPVHETTTAFDTTAGYGHALGYSLGSNSPGTGQSVVLTDALGGYAYGSTTFQTQSTFKCEVLEIPQCLANDMYCTWEKNTGCKTKPAASGVALKPLLPASPYFFSKINLHAKGTVRTVFVDIDTRTRLGEMNAFRDRAVAFFKEVFGLNFEYFNTYEGAQMIPFKWTDELYIQIQNAFLPAYSETIPERNRVLVDGFLVKPLAGESVVLGGLYANSKKKKTVFLEAHEVLIFLEYRVVDEYNRLYHIFEFYLKYPLATNRVGITGWTATVVRRDPYTNKVDESYGLGIAQGILEIVTFDNLQDVAFTDVITFDGFAKNVTKTAIYDYENV